jgi:hypothetical protein
MGNMDSPENSPKSLTGYVRGWCQANGWTDLFVDHYQYWAFPPGAVMPLPVPATVLSAFQHDSQPVKSAQVVYGLLILASGVAMVWSGLQHSPMPLVLAFCMSAIAVAFLDTER